MSSPKVHKLTAKKPKQATTSQLPLFEKEEDEGIVRLVPENAYRIVGDEVLSEQLDPETWAKALASGGRTKEAALSMYAHLRSQELAEETASNSAKAEALEFRKMTVARETNEERGKTLLRKNFSLVWDFLFWQALLSISGVGLYLIVLAMGPNALWWPGWLPVLIVSFCLQISPMILYLSGRLLLGRVRYHRALGLTALLVISLGGLCAITNLRGKRLPVMLRVESIAGAQAIPVGADSDASADEEEF